MSAHVSFDQEIPGFQALSANAVISLSAVKPVAPTALRFAWCVNTVGVLQTIGQRALPWLLPVGLVLLWQLASSQGWLSSRVLPAPSDVARAAWRLSASGELWVHVGVSAVRALTGLAVGGGLVWRLAC